MKKSVFNPNMGNEFDFGVLEANKIHIKLDAATLQRDATTGEIGLVSGVITVVSADAGNQLTAGTDGGVLLTKEVFEDLVGAMVINATDGLTYDDALGALTSAVASAVGTATPTVDTTATLSADGVLDLKADVKISADAGNLLTAVADGLKVVAPATTAALTIEPGDKLQLVVNGVTTDIQLEAIQDAFGVHQGFMFQ